MTTRTLLVLTVCLAHFTFSSEYLKFKPEKRFFNIRTTVTHTQSCSPSTITLKETLISTTTETSISVSRTTFARTFYSTKSFTTTSIVTSSPVLTLTVVTSTRCTNTPTPKLPPVHGYILQRLGDQQTPANQQQKM